VNELDAVADPLPVVDAHRRNVELAVAEIRQHTMLVANSAMAARLAQVPWRHGIVAQRNSAEAGGLRQQRRCQSRQKCRIVEGMP
jgi:hypothetical protein